MADTGPTFREPHHSSLVGNKQEKYSTEQIERENANSSENGEKLADHHGDQGDGKIHWTKTQRAAVISLSALWVGKSLSDLLF